MQKKSQACLLLSIFLFTFGCSTLTPDSRRTDRHHPSVPSVDYNHIQAALGMNRPSDKLGFEEKAFNDCDLGLRNTHCRTQYFTVVHFRLQCRDSTGTVQSVSNIELRPVISRNVRWRIHQSTGLTTTDNRGYGQIRFVSPTSQRPYRMSLQVNENALGVRVAEVTRVVVPRDWCQP